MMINPRWILLLLCLLTPPLVGADELSQASSLYVRQSNLQKTMLDTRQRYAAWLSAQPEMRAAVQCEPWLATPSLSALAADTLVWRDGSVDLAAVTDAGQALWTEQEGLPDGQVANFRAGSADTVVYLTRTVRAAHPVRVTVGLGGGDHLEVWLNGRQVASRDTHLVSGRYGCGERVDGTRVDQVVMDLDLREGANELVARMVLGNEPSFYFSTAPDPTAWLWQQLRSDFPPTCNPLWSLVHATWFEKEGWLTSQGLELEEPFIGQLVAMCGDEGAMLRAEWNQLKRAGADRDDPRWLDVCVKGSVAATLYDAAARLRLAVTELSRAYGESYPGDEFSSRLDAFERAVRTQTTQRLDPDDEATRQWMAMVPRLQREMLVDRNRLLRDTEIVFVRRYTYNSQHYYDDFQHISRWGGNLCVLSMSDGQVRELVPELTGGIFDRYDLSFDASRIVFGYRRPRAEGFRLHEVGTDGSNLRQVLAPPEDEAERIVAYGRTSTGDSFYGLQGYHFWTDDVHPCYLPDGGICFASTRCEHGVLCTPSHYLACTNLFRVQADGSGLRPLSHGAFSEFSPTVMEDGRILYNRWEQTPANNFHGGISDVRVYSGMLSQSEVQQLAAPSAEDQP